MREDLRERPSISPKRRAVILGALGPAVHRAIQKGRVRTRAELGELVGFIRARLEERRGLGEDLGATRRWAEWCVREGLRRVEEGRAARAAAARFLAEEARARAEARRAWADPEAQAQVAALLQAALGRPRSGRGKLVEEDDLQLPHGLEAGVVGEEGRGPGVEGRGDLEGVRGAQAVAGAQVRGALGDRRVHGNKGEVGVGGEEIPVVAGHRGPSLP
ncbi:MAG: hypothetical protein QXQ66_07240, partial [Candidatus Hadarchaeum sp.]